MPTLEEMARMRIVLQVPGMERVVVRRDLTYRQVDDVALGFDVYRPPAVPVERRLPVVVLVHGGPVPAGTHPKDWGVFVSTAELLAASGLAAVAFDHRLHAPTRFPEAESDVAALVEHVRARATELGLDADRIALWAYSGGGPLLSPFLRDAPSWLRGVVAYYAALDLQQVPEGVPDVVGVETRRAYSPVHHLATAARLPPLLVARAALDHPWLNGGIDRFVEAARARRAPLELLEHAAGHHGFEILDDVERSREILRRTLAFLSTELTP